MAQAVAGRLKAPDLLDVRQYKGGRSSAKRTGQRGLSITRQIPLEGRLYPWRNPWYSFSEAEVTSGYMALSEGTTEKNPK